MPNLYYGSDGKRYSEATIKANLSKAYRAKYGGEAPPVCEGCGRRAIETSHIIEKAECKVLKKTELIWSHENMFPACRECHMKWEAINNPAWCGLMGVERFLKVLSKYHPQEYNKRIEIYNQWVN